VLDRCMMPMPMFTASVRRTESDPRTHGSTHFPPPDQPDASCSTAPRFSASFALLPAALSSLDTKRGVPEIKQLAC
jgi:hypothetical protein